jgi:hypothetical protein
LTLVKILGRIVTSLVIKPPKSSLNRAKLTGVGSEGTQRSISEQRSRKRIGPGFLDAQVTSVVPKKTLLVGPGSKPIASIPGGPGGETLFRFYGLHPNGVLSSTIRKEIFSVCIRPATTAARILLRNSLDFTNNRELRKEWYHFEKIKLHVECMAKNATNLFVKYKNLITWIAYLKIDTEVSKNLLETILFDDPLYLSKIEYKRQICANYLRSLVRPCYLVECLESIDPLLKLPDYNKRRHYHVIFFQTYKDTFNISNSNEWDSIQFQKDIGPFNFDDNGEVKLNPNFYTGIVEDFIGYFSIQQSDISKHLSKTNEYQFIGMYDTRPSVCLKNEISDIMLHLLKNSNAPQSFPLTENDNVEDDNSNSFSDPKLVINLDSQNYFALKTFKQVDPGESLSLTDAILRITPFCESTSFDGHTFLTYHSNPVIRKTVDKDTNETRLSLYTERGVFGPYRPVVGYPLCTYIGEDCTAEKLVEFKKIYTVAGTILSYGKLSWYKDTLKILLKFKTQKEVPQGKTSNG